MECAGRAQRRRRFGLCVSFGGLKINPKRGRRFALPPHSKSPVAYNFARRNLNAFPITETELKLIAAAASIGLKRIPKNG